jgi:predicted O-linked N-acetylglucosamine transferase (SPINDLY family)
MSLRAVKEDMRARNIHVLVDTNTLAYGGLMDLIAMKPAPIIIGYLGFPEHCYFPEIDYRIVDRVTNSPLVENNTALYAGARETSLFLPRSFLCWHPFPNFTEREIAIQYATRKDEVVIGIYNKICKHSVVVRRVWAQLARQFPFVKFIIKLNEYEHGTQLYAHGDTRIDPVQLVIKPFEKNLARYYELFNQVDICADTFPYAGTTTTCSALFMGIVPVVFGRTNRHVSNVSESILEHCGFVDNVTTNETEYRLLLEQKIQKVRREKTERYAFFLEQEQLRRHLVRNQFLEAMEPRAFMRDYETAIKGVVESHANN